MTGYLRLMADYCSDGVWNENGAMADRDDLPVSAGLKDEIARWCAVYEDSQFYLGAEDRTVDFDTASFNAEGEALAAKLRAELPDWRIEHRPQD